MLDDPFENLVRAPRRRVTRRRVATSVQRAEDRPYPGPSEHMLLQDLRTYSLPYGRGSSDGFDVIIEPAEPELTQLIHDALPSTSYRHWRIADSIRDFVDSALWRLIDGDLDLEVQYYHALDNPDGEPVAFGIKILDAERIVRHRGRYCYIVSDGDRFDGPRPWGAEELDPRCLVNASLPRALRRDLERALNLIRMSDRDITIASSFVMGNHGNNSGFDFAAHRRMSNDIVLKGTSTVGWAGRGLLTEGLLDPEKAWRAISFGRFAARMRDVAMGALNESISRAGARLDFAASLTLSRVPTGADFDQMERDLQAGRRPISQLLVPWLSNEEPDAEARDIDAGATDEKL